MQCPRCHAQNLDGSGFGEERGARLEVACPSCGQPVGIGKKFCRSCGTMLAAQATDVTSPESYTPRHLVEKILNARGVLEGERKLVTVLFADLKGSMGLLADRDPEEARRRLDPVLERMMEAVHRYEGTVTQVEIPLNRSRGYRRMRARSPSCGEGHARAAEQANRAPLDSRRLHSYTPRIHVRALKVRHKRYGSPDQRARETVASRG